MILGALKHMHFLQIPGVVFYGSKEQEHLIKNRLFLPRFRPGKAMKLLLQELPIGMRILSSEKSRKKKKAWGYMLMKELTTWRLNQALVWKMAISSRLA